MPFLSAIDLDAYSPYIASGISDVISTTIQLPAALSNAVDIFDEMLKSPDFESMFCDDLEP